MFGYVNVYKDELKMKDYNMYRCIYCGVCMACADKLSFSSRFTLSYDAAFLALVLTSAAKDDTAVTARRCFANPLKKRPVANVTREIEYAACVGLVLAYFKLKDDWRDERKLTALLASLFLRAATKKARKKYPEMCAVIENGLEELSRLEEKNCMQADEPADAFAQMLGKCFTPDFVEENQKRQFYWIGYYIGRWIYLIDAVNDLEQDIKKDGYNPYKKSFSTRNEAAKTLSVPFTLTLESAAASYELLDTVRNRELLDNIFYKGLYSVQEDVFNGKHRPLQGVGGI